MVYIVGRIRIIHRNGRDLPLPLGEVAAHRADGEGKSTALPSQSPPFGGDSSPMGGAKAFSITLAIILACNQHAMNAAPYERILDFHF